MDYTNKCTGCAYYRNDVGGSKYCHYAVDTEKCRIIDGRIIPSKECYKKKIFFKEAK